jgi:ubiquinone/menaquinone biosynthesis C-methylase UbiE
MDNIFEEKTFDYIFCNLVFHHLLGEDFKSSEKIRETVLTKIGKVLKDDGHVGIIEIFNDGFIVDSISCRILYNLTSMTNPVMVKIFRILGSYSAGVGVCMLSKKMWKRLIGKCNLKIVQEIDSPPAKLNIIKKIGLLNKRYSEHNLMVLEKDVK